MLLKSDQFVFPFLANEGKACPERNSTISNVHFNESSKSEIATTKANLRLTKVKLSESPVSNRR